MVDGIERGSDPSGGGQSWTASELVFVAGGTEATLDLLTVVSGTNANGFMFDAFTIQTTDSVCSN